MFPRRVVGSVTGLGGMFGSLAGMAMIAGVGVIREITGTYFYVFLAASLAYLTSMLILHLLVPKLEPAQIDAPAGA
jgi:ACS family hexuronate transporter-like MFS transporter